MFNARLIKKIATSTWLKFVLVVAGVAIYNQLCYRQHWMTAQGGFGDTAAPLYAKLHFWIQQRIKSPPQGIADFISQLDAPAWQRIAPVLRQHAIPLIAPLILFALICGGIVVQFATRRTIPSWVIAGALPILAVCVNVSVAEMNGGRAALVAPFERTELEYFGDVDRVNDQPAAFIGNYASLVGDSFFGQRLSLHSRTHPPGAVLFLWWIARHIAPDVRTAAWAAIIASALATVPAYLLTRHRFGNIAGLLAAGMILFTPSLVLFGATSMDGVFALPLVTALWLLTTALVRRFDDARPYARLPEWSSIIRAALAGIALTVAAFMSYASVCIGIFVAIFLLMQLWFSRPWFVRSIIVMAVVTLVFIACNFCLQVACGYDPITCVQASRVADDQADHFVRLHWIDVSFANLIAFAIGAGLITTTLWLSASATSIVQTIRRRETGGLFEIAMLAAVILISFSRLFTLETERIWIFLMPLLIAPAANHLYRTSPSSTALALRSFVVLLLLMMQTWLCELTLNTWW